MNPLLEKKIIEEVNNPVNILVMERRMGDESFRLMRGTQTRMEIYNGWDYGIWTLTVAGENLFSVKSGELAFDANPAKKSYLNILNACRARSQAETRQSLSAGYEQQIQKMNAAERAIFDYLCK